MRHTCTPYRKIVYPTQNTMTSVFKNKHDRQLAETAFAAVTRYGRDWLFQANADTYAVQLPQGRLERLHGGGRADVYLFIHENKRYCLKWFHDTRLISRLRNGFGFSKAVQSYKTSEQLEELNIKAPRVLGVLQPERFGTTLLIMEMLENFQQLNLMLEDWKSQGSGLTSDPRFRKLAEQFGHFTQNLHCKKVLHRDFSPRNILVTEVNTNFNFCLIDLEDVYFGTAPKSNLRHFNDRLPRYLHQTERTFFLEHFHKAYTGSQS